MSVKNKEYVSIFKINGKSILPPLMTEKRRIEMRHYREIAKLIENTKQNSNKLKRPTNFSYPLNSTSDTESQLTIDSYLKVSNILKNCTANSKRNSIENLTKSETFIYDLLSNSLITSNTPSSSNENSPRINENEFNCGFDAYATPLFNIKQRLINAQATSSERSKVILENLPINDFAAPTISIVPATPVIQSKPIVPGNSLDNKTVSNPVGVPIVIQRSATSPSLLLEDSSDSTLIRSNSFTLENPSKALLEHIQNRKAENQRKYSTATKDTVESNAKKVQKVNKSSSFANKNIPKPKPLTSNSNMKNRRSPYDVKISSSKMKLRKHKSPTGLVLKGKTSLLRNNATNNNNCPKLLLSMKLPSPTKQIINNNTPNLSLSNNPESPVNKFMIKSIEDQHKEKLMKLILAQKAEQKRMQDEFTKQQSELIDQLSLEMKNTTTTDKMISIPTTLNEPKSPELPKKPLTTPRRQLIFKDHTSPDKNNQKEIAHSKRRNLAATKINALVRGYLTRRLFNTDYVQRVVQTIRDTLMFVLDLHMETAYDESEENTRLKARLLQQLSSACDCLHKIFFEITTKDRMAIISKDRKCIQNKMANLSMSSRRY